MPDNEVASCASVGTDESLFLRAFFDALGDASVEYAVMRNYETLPVSAGGSDVDIFVFPGWVEKAEEILFATVKHVNGDAIGSLRTWNFVEVYVIGFANERWWGVSIELYSEISYKSTLSFVNLSVVNRSIGSHNGVKVVNRDVGNTLGYLKEILAHGAFKRNKPEYKESAVRLVGRRPKLFKEVFAPFGDFVDLLLGRVFNNSSSSDAQAAIREMRFAMLIKAFLRNPLFFMYRRLGHELFRLRRFITPPGSVIAILGVDGAGKSTVINAILPALNAATHNAVHVRHLRPSVLPPLARLKGREHYYPAAGPALEPHASTPSGKLGSLFRLAYLTLDYIVGYWLWTRVKIAKQPTLVIFDRYAYDMALDPRRFRIGLPGRVAGWFAALAPRPDLIICLHGNPELIAARKQELPVEETRRQVEALRAFARKEPRAVLVSTDTSIDETRDQVLHVVCDFLRQKAGAGR